jgi:hypothetical protein
MSDMDAPAAACDMARDTARYQQAEAGLSQV